MNWSKLIRQTHRWLGMTLIALTLANIVAMSTGNAMMWLTYLPLLPLFLLMISGTYMFVQPYLARRRAGSGA
jgi:hypothetical protein